MPGSSAVDQLKECHPAPDPGPGTKKVIDRFDATILKVDEKSD